MNDNKKKKNKRPVMTLPLTNLEKVLELLSGMGVLFNLVLVIIAWGTVPDRIPTHFDPSGLPDSWGGKESLILLPMAVIFLYSLLTVVSRFPHTFNYPWKITEENAKAQYLNARYLLVFLKTEIIGFFTYIQWVTIQVALGKAQGLGLIFLPIFLIIIFGTVVVYFFKARQNK